MDSEHHETLRRLKSQAAGLLVQMEYRDPAETKAVYEILGRLIRWRDDHVIDVADSLSTSVVKGISAAFAQEVTDTAAMIQAMPEPAYVTDADGIIAAYNEPAVAFAGRRPLIGVDRWCIAYKLYTDDGEHLPHDECPMARCLRENIPIRGVHAWAERPDGQRVGFTPHPTPIRNEHGKLIGAFNAFIPDAPGNFYGENVTPMFRAAAG